ncbi:RNA polymerase subunit [Dunaliella salina]|uniref:RNA polymerase subunit n=1 Tax=Dunaliella salina TaxID=3046 RepID=A0ABQ7H509_DUNSA|nr:RNA polymerase subunit [Dunaliella salina]|eukprot:KAF5841945.1 RNA polymerase subunit [Dunaliella salina]
MVNAKYQVALANTLNADGTAGSTNFDATFPGITGKPSLMDRYEYVMYGKVYKYKDAFSGGQVKVEVYISFGGLLMLLVGDPKKLQDLEVDSSVYLLVRKV